MPYYHVAITKKTGGDRYAFVFDLSRERIETEIISPFKQQKPFMCCNSYIPPNDIENIVISETTESAAQILTKTRNSRLVRRLARFIGSDEENIDQWTVIRSGKDVTRDLTRESYTLEKRPSKPEISKEELRNYLEEYLRLYRTEVKEKCPIYFNDFPFFSAVRAIGVITPNYVYLLFTKDGNPKTTLIDVFDENDIPELLRVKDVINMKEQDVFALLGIKTVIPDHVQTFWQEHHYGLRSSFVGSSISRAVEDSIKNHYTNYVETGKDPTYVVSGEYKSPAVSKYTFLTNTVDDTTLSNKIEEIIEKVEEGEVLVAGWIDSFGMRLLNSLAKRNVKFRVITHRPSTSGGWQPPSDTSEAFDKLVKEYGENVRVLTKLHTRLLISDKEALVSTADLTKDSLGAKYESGISTTDGLTIVKMKEFFEKMWASSNKLSAPKSKDQRQRG